MDEITILHLSDLHITETGEKYSKVLEYLIKDIGKEITYVKDNSLIVAVTGDIINEGVPYKDNSAAYNHTLLFFEDLKKCLGSKACGIYLVPGNHDKVRTDKDCFLIPSYRIVDEKYNSTKSKFDDRFLKSFWDSHLEAYKKEKGTGYLDLIKEIYRIFGMSEEDISEKQYINNTYGVDVIEVNGKKFCFVLLNTAWSCVNDFDDRNLFLGFFQIQSLVEQFHALTDMNRPDLTIVLGHHPLSALHGKEEDLLFKELIAFESLDANIYLCGHTHDREVVNWVNNRHSITTLVTGIGWPDKPEKNKSHVNSHTYATYVIDIDLNSVDVYMRDTNDVGSFKTDFRIYTNKNDATLKKITFPIKSHDVQTYIELSRGRGRSEKACYLTEDYLIFIKNYLINISRIEQELGVFVERNKHDLLDIIKRSDNSNLNGHESVDDVDVWESLRSYLFSIDTDEDNEEEEDEEEDYNLDEENSVNDLLRKHQDALFEMLLTFLQKICMLFQKHLVENDFEKKDVVRFHFRYLADRTQYLYKCLCLSFPYYTASSDFSLSDIKYGQLIEESFYTGKGLIYSINKQYTDNDLKAKWSNFITVVPTFDKNIYEKDRKRQGIKKVPYLTFGVTINSGKYDILLYCMDFFNIKKTIDDAIGDFVNTYKIDVGMFCKWAKKYKESEKSR